MITAKRLLGILLTRQIGIFKISPLSEKLVIISFKGDIILIAYIIC